MKSNNQNIDKLVPQFCKYCIDNLDLNENHRITKYNSISLCILDCVYSLRTKYEVTRKIVDRYIEKHLKCDKNAKKDNCKNLFNNINKVGVNRFANEILKNNQKLAGRIKSEICSDLCERLLWLNINSLEEFKKFKNIELLEVVISSVKGLGNAGVNYLFMLAGDKNRCKPDVHIKRFVKNACNVEFTDENDYQILFSKAVKELKKKYKNISSVGVLDGIIWRKYQSK